MLMTITWPNELTADDFKEIRLLESHNELKQVIGDHETYRLTSTTKDGLKLFRWLEEEYPNSVFLTDGEEPAPPEPTPMVLRTDRLMIIPLLRNLWKRNK